MIVESGTKSMDRRSVCEMGSDEGGKVALGGGDAGGQEEGRQASRGSAAQKAGLSTNSGRTGGSECGVQRSQWSSWAQVGRWRAEKPKTVKRVKRVKSQWCPGFVCTLHNPVHTGGQGSGPFWRLDQEDGSVVSLISANGTRDN